MLIQHEKSGYKNTCLLMNWRYNVTLFFATFFWNILILELAEPKQFQYVIMSVYILLVSAVIKRYLIFNYAIDGGLTFESKITGITRGMNSLIWIVICLLGKQRLSAKRQTRVTSMVLMTSLVKILSTKIR